MQEQVGSAGFGSGVVNPSRPPHLLGEGGLFARDLPACKNSLPCLVASRPAPC